VILGKVFSPLRSVAPLLVRVAVGVVFLYHGADKVGLVGADDFRTSIRAAIGAAEHAGFRPAEFWGYALALTELVGGALLVVGFATRYAALSLAFVMGVAVFQVHWNAGFSLANQGYEYALTLMLCCLSLVFSGSGVLSVDQVFRGGKAQ
jgi:putative oxidoreductase